MTIIRQGNLEDALFCTNSREKLILLRNCLMFQRYREKVPSGRKPSVPA